MGLVNTQIVVQAPGGAPALQATLNRKLSTENTAEELRAQNGMGGVTGTWRKAASRSPIPTTQKSVSQLAVG